ncbi:TPA: hypothetical protein PXL93_004401 [Yersinia enterocolitica]|nr:hypothetical protein [Yersinia enterocolitica]HDL6901646.1 hypothetical protein [Yersinia enterocolitica]HDL7505285.1 hypothetical protein [Yersinia enterocolitica]
MNRTDDPKKQPIPFGVNGPREDIEPTTPTGDNSASYNSGFPPITMLLKAAGGLPPKGQDMNQILYELSSLARWTSAGALNVFDSTFSLSISGYPKGAVLSNSTFTGCWLNTTDANTANPENTDGSLTGWVPAFAYGTTALAGLAAANVILTALQAANERITLAGTLTANINLVLPAWRKSWTIVNNCTGPFTVTCKTPSGTGIGVATGVTARVIGDGTNIIANESSLTAGALQKSANLSDLSSVPTALTNLGLSDVAHIPYVQTLGARMVSYLTAGAFTFTVPAEVTRIRARVVGGGGGAGGSAAAKSGGGGGAGGYSEDWITVTAGQVLSITVGANGAGGTTGNAGTAGSVSSVSGYLSASGGAYGDAGGGGTGAGGFGGAGTGGSINTVGSDGTDGATTATVGSGIGGGSVLGGSTRSGGTGRNSLSIGGGGAASYTLTSQNGGNGHAGAVILEY